MKDSLRGALFAALLLAAAPLSAGSTLPAEGKVEVAFAPWDDVERLVMDQIDGARQAIYVQAYTLTSRNIAKTLIAAAERGVKVEVLADRDKVLKDERSAVPRMIDRESYCTPINSGTNLRSNQFTDPDSRLIIPIPQTTETIRCPARATMN